MKLYEIQHINEAKNPNRGMGLELVFLRSVCPMTGVLRDPCRQPNDWNHVRRLTDMLFFAWDDKNPLEGSVYVGDFVQPAVAEDQPYV